MQPRSNAQEMKGVFSNEMLGHHHGHDVTDRTDCCRLGRDALSTVCINKTRDFADSGLVCIFIVDFLIYSSALCLLFISFDVYIYCCIFYY